MLGGRSRRGSIGDALSPIFVEHRTEISGRWFKGAVFGDVVSVCDGVIAVSDLLDQLRTQFFPHRTVVKVVVVEIDRIPEDS